MSITETLKELEKALDLRFEKDSALYISKEDTESIKEALAKSNFQNINAFIVKFGNKVVSKVILKYSWLIDFNRSERDLKKIFDAVDTNFLATISQDIIEDKIFSTVAFKTFIEGYTMKTISIKECVKIYKNPNEKIENRADCFGRYLKEEYVPNNSVQNSVRFIEQEFSDNKDVYNFVQTKNSNFLVPIFKNTNEMDTLVSWVITNKIGDKTDKIWGSIFGIDKNIAFQKSLEHIDGNPQWENLATKILINKKLKSFAKIDNFEEEIVELYTNHYILRKLFLQMLEPGKFKDKVLVNSIVDRFESVGLPNNSDAIVESIRDGKAEKMGYSSLETAIQKIQSSGQNFDNMKTLGFYAMNLEKTDKTIIQALYDNNLDNNIQKIIAYFLANFLRSRRIPIHFKSIASIENYMIANYIDKLHINTDSAKEFLEEYNHYEVLTKINQR
ncbi:MAG: hypothetical protein JJV88_02730 [Sulfurovum sp.]|nr:hypothetical protein [Sulfurovaceae bacterium]